MNGIASKGNVALAIAVMIFSLAIMLFSISMLVKGALPTLFVFVLGCSFFFALGAFYFMVHRNKEDEYGLDSDLYGPRIGKLAALFFYILLIVGILIVAQSLYVLPTSYYFVVSLASSLIVLQIILVKDKDIKRCVGILALQLIPLAIVLRSSFLVSNPHLVGPDVFSHYHSIQNVIASGQLDPSAYHYYYYPSYHLTQSVDGLVIGFSGGSFNAINILISVVCVPVSFAIGRQLFRSNKAGLVLALLITISTMQIFLVDFNTSKIGGLTLLIICLFVLLKMYSRVSIGLKIVLWISAVSLIFWHPEVAVALIALLVGKQVTSIRKSGHFMMDHTLCIYAVAFIGYLAVVYFALFGSTVNSLFVEVTPGLIQSFEGRSIAPLMLVQAFVGYLGITFAVLFVTSTALDWVKSLSLQRSFVIFSTLAIMLLPLFGVFLGSFALNPERTMTYFSTMLIVISAGMFLRMIDSRRKIRVIASVGVIFLLSIASVSSYLIGDGNRVFDNAVPQGTGYTTESNLVSHEFLLSLPRGSAINGDSDSLRFTTDSDRGIFGLPGVTTSRFPTVSESAYLLLNLPNLERSVWRSASWGVEVYNSTLNRDLLYNNGNILVYSGNGGLLS